MRSSEAAKLLRIYVCESDEHEGKTLYEAIVAKCREMGMAGATVLRGLEGFGESGEMHTAHLRRSDRPVEILVVDESEKVAALAVVVEQMMDTGLVEVSDVECVRLQK
jgi:uncharacterized protein